MIPYHYVMLIHQYKKTHIICMFCIMIKISYLLLHYYITITDIKCKHI